MYFIDHMNQTNQIEDPRQQWRQLQEAMLKDYLITAQEDLEAKKEIYDIKQQRLTLAQDEYQHLNNALVNLNNSHSSLSSSSSASSTKYDPDLLKADVALAKNRVTRLKRELEQIRTEMIYKQKGVETLAQVDEKLASQHGVYNVTEAQAIMLELRNIQKSLSSGEKEKVELMQSLARLKDELTRLQPNESSPDVSTLSIPQEKLSTASQTDISGELAPIGARLAEMARMRLQYDEARKQVHNIQQQLADLEDKVTPGQSESDKDRLLLIQEKEQLLRELRSINPKSRSNIEMAAIENEIKKLEQDLYTAMELSNRAITDRLKIHEQKQFLLQKLKDAMRLTTNLESQLKSLSASTLSMSSSSSLGSLSTTSSKGSLSSLSFTDIYGLPQCSSEPVLLQDLHKRVEKLLQGSSGSESNEELTSERPSQPIVPSHSAPSLSPRSSLSSVSPPISPYEFGPPPTYEQAYLGSVERQRRTALGLQHPLAFVNPPNMPFDHLHLEDKLAELRLIQESKENSGSANTMPNVLNNANSKTNGLQNRTFLPNIPITDTLDINMQNSTLNRPRSMYDSGSDINSNPPLSPISEMVPDELKTVLSETNTCSVSAAVSDESVAGDSGVFEASNKHNEDFSLCELNLETAQIQIKLRYASSDSLLHIGIERARNLVALPFPENCKVCIRLALLPSSSNATSACCTRLVQDLAKPTFGEVFRFSVPLSKLHTKTLQVNIWAVSTNSEEECLGCTQVSLADFNQDAISCKWYNILSFHFMQQDSHKISDSNLHKNLENEETNSSKNKKVIGKPETDTGIPIQHNSIKEESSDESTIISSQTSTLTRNQGPDVFEGEFKNDDAEAGGESDEEDEDEHRREEDDDVSLDYPHKLYPPQMFDYLEHLDETVIAIDDKFTGETCDKETNTECVFIPEKGMKKRSDDGSRTTVIKRSQTFSPSAPVNRNEYICKLNRSDSDSSMPLYRRGSFQRNAVERRSLRWKKASGKSSKGSGTSDGLMRTSIDLELDLQAQQTKLRHLKDEINRLKELKRRLEDAKAKGETELPSWLSENEQLQMLLSSANKEVTKLNPEEKKIEKLLKKTSREIYKLRKSRKQQPDITSFREKMAFFTRVNLHIPPLPPESDCEDDDLCRFKSNQKKENNTVKETVTEIGEQTPPLQHVNSDEEQPCTKYEYTIDRDLGVQV